MNYLYLVAVGVLLSSCMVKQTSSFSEIDTIKQKAQKPYIKEEYIEDLKYIPQDVEFYSKSINSSSFSSQEEYEKKYFRVWNIKKSEVSLNEAMWAHSTYKVGNTYGENLQLLEQSFYDTLLDNANYKNYKTLNKKGLTLKRLDIRAMPSNKPILLDPTKAGEGFPFDYLQNSSIAANKPVIISHYSKDKKWVFVESSFAYGWVKSANIVVLNEKYTEKWQQAEQIFITKEGTPIYSVDGEFLFKSRIGMMLALVKEDETSYTVLTVSKYKNKKALFIKSKLDKTIASKNIIEFNSENINKILKEVSKTNYGWGGMYAQRDCSSTLRDFYTPFGLWLPRNSYQQSISGEVTSLVDMTNDARVKLINEKATPFRTLIYKKGHIGLYVGRYKEVPIIYQNVWGVKTKKDGVEGRFIIGKPIFSTLEVGSNLKNYDTNASMLSKLKSFTKL